MLGELNKKDLAARAKKMKAAAQALPTEDLKLKVVVDAAPSPVDDEETFLGRSSKGDERSPLNPPSSSS